MAAVIPIGTPEKPVALVHEEDEEQAKPYSHKVKLAGLVALIFAPFATIAFSLTYLAVGRLLAKNQTWNEIKLAITDTFHEITDDIPEEIDESESSSDDDEEEDRQ